MAQINMYRCNRAPYHSQTCISRRKKQQLWRVNFLLYKRLADTGMEKKKNLEMAILKWRETLRDSLSQPDLTKGQKAPEVLKEK